MVGFFSFGFGYWVWDDQKSNSLPRLQISTGPKKYSPIPYPNPLSDPFQQFRLKRQKCTIIY